MLHHLFRRRPRYQRRSSPTAHRAELEEAASQAEFEAEMAGIRAEIAAVDADQARIAARTARRRVDTAEMVAAGIIEEESHEEA